MGQFKVNDRIFYHDWLDQRVEGTIEHIDHLIMSIRLNAKVSTTARLADGIWQAFRIGEGEYRDEIFKIVDKRSDPVK